jgi:hypothetical protein
VTGRLNRDAAEVKRRRAGLFNWRHPCQLTNEKVTTGGGEKMDTETPRSGGVVTRPWARGGGWKGGGEARGRLAELPRRTGRGRSGGGASGARRRGAGRGGREEERQGRARDHPAASHVPIGGGGAILPTK